MTDSLRDRIAAAIYATPPVWDQWPWDDLTDDARQVFREQADAVIAALNLEVETRYPTSVGREINVKGHYTEWVGTYE